MKYLILVATVTLFATVSNGAVAAAPTPLTILNKLAGIYSGLNVTNIFFPDKFSCSVQITKGKGTDDSPIRVDIRGGRGDFDEGHFVSARRFRISEDSNENFIHLENIPGRFGDGYGTTYPDLKLRLNDEGTLISIESYRTYNGIGGYHEEGCENLVKN